MNPLFISDIFVLVCEQLGTIRDILRLELLSSRHQRIIRNHNWMIKLDVCNDIEMEHIIRNYRFRNLSIDRRVNINNFVKELKNCHTLDLFYTNITDESVRELKNCHTLDLRYTKITDASVRELKNCHTLYLSHTNVTDDSIRELKNCHTLDLAGTDVTDTSIRELINCHTLNLAGTDITDESVKELKNCHTL